MACNRRKLQAARVGAAGVSPAGENRASAIAEAAALRCRVPDENRRDTSFPFHKPAPSRLLEALDVSDLEERVQEALLDGNDAPLFELGRGLNLPTCKLQRLLDALER